MKLLKDDELLACIDRTDPVIKGIDRPADWYSTDSPVQPSSVDLHIGSIFLPGTTRDDPGGESRPKREHILEQGQTGVVETIEEFSLPGHMAGIGFPPSRVSFQGILMTNPGHIDPGYAGRMRFTVINMGRQKYVLRRGDVIVTALLVVLSGPAHRDWLQRRGGSPAGPPTQENLDRLSADFMDVERRAARISKEAVHKAEFDIKILQWVAPVIVAIITTVVGGYFAWARPAWKELEDVKREMAVLRTNADLTTIKRKLEEHERLLRGTEQAPRSSGPSQPARPQDVPRRAPSTRSGHIK